MALGDKALNLEHENEDLRARLAEAEEALAAIRNGEVDALLVSNASGEQVYTLESADSAYRLLVETMQQGAATILEDGSIFYSNQYLARLLNIPLQQLIGSSIYSLIAAPDAAQFQLLIKSAQRCSSEGELRFTTADGVVPVFIALNPLALEGRAGLCMVVTDLSPIAAAQRLAQVNEQLEREIGERQKAEAALQELNYNLEERVKERTRRLQALTQQLSQAEEQERRRLAEILHDDLQQLLVATKMHLSRITMYDPKNQQLGQMVTQTSSILNDAINKTRNLSHELSPPFSGQQDLSVSLEWLCAQMKTKHNLNVHLIMDPEIEVPDAIRAFFFRAAQELLFNVIKHARVDSAEINVRHLDGTIVLTVTDHGRGFDKERMMSQGRIETGFGLFSIQERIELLGGRFDIESAPGFGSRFTLAAPCEAQSIEDQG